MRRSKYYLGMSVLLVTLGLMGIAKPVNGLCGDCGSPYGDGDMWCVSNPPNFIFCHSWERRELIFTWRPDGMPTFREIVVQECEAYGECAY